MHVFLRNKELIKLLTEIKNVSGMLWSKGWAESNAGNFSVNITDLCKNLKIDVSKISSIKTNNPYKSLRNNFLLLSGSGSKMRDISDSPIPGLCLLLINDTGNSYYNIPLENSENVKPTSELLMHLETQNLLRELNAPEKVLLHTHPAELIALTHLKNLNNEKNLKKLFLLILPEFAATFPEGIGFVPYYKTGSEKLASKTKKKFKNHKIVIWEKHGCVSAGKDLSSAFDKIDVLVKSAKIFFLCRSAGNKPKGLNVQQIKELKNLSGK